MQTAVACSNYKAQLYKPLLAFEINLSDCSHRSCYTVNLIYVNGDSRIFLALLSQNSKPHQLLRHQGRVRIHCGFLGSVVSSHHRLLALCSTAPGHTIIVLQTLPLYAHIYVLQNCNCPCKHPEKRNLKVITSGN